MLSASYGPDRDAQLQSNLILWMQSESWEGDNLGSLVYWAGDVSILAAALAVACLVNRRLAGLLIIGGVAQYIFMMSQPPHGWYWFPVVLCAVIPFCMLGPKAAAGVGLVLAACLYPLTSTVHELAYKQEHLRELEQVAAQRQCVAAQLTQMHPDVVYDMAAIGTFMAGTGQHS